MIKITIPHTKKSKQKKLNDNSIKKILNSLYRVSSKFYEIPYDSDFDSSVAVSNSNRTQKRPTLALVPYDRVDLFSLTYSLYVI